MAINEIKIGNTRHPIEDTTAREHLVEVGSTQPVSEANKLWIKNQEQEYEVPTMTEFNNLMSAITQNSTEELLLRDDLPGTTTTVTMDNNGNPTSIVHSANGETVRSDVFVWVTGSVTETRTASGYYITITTNLDTLAQTISEIQEVA